MLVTKGNSNRFTQARASNYDTANRNVLLIIDNLSAFLAGSSSLPTCPDSNKLTAFRKISTTT